MRNTKGNAVQQATTSRALQLTNMNATRDKTCAKQQCTPREDDMDHIQGNPKV
jgi:hypothetical protein